jgi:hypothetical protein
MAEKASAVIAITSFNGRGAAVNLPTKIHETRFM